MNREYCERWLKSCLKKKVSITSSTIIMFLMTGLIMTTPVYGALNDAGTGSASGVAQGTGSNAVGADSIAIGTTANSAGDRTIAIGKNASTNNYESIAIGNDSKTTSNNNIAIGKGAIASGNNNSIAFGNGSSATGNDGALAVGRDSNAGGNNGIALGREANATGNQSVAIGKGANASSNSTVALGQDSKATASGASALSVGATASGNNAVAISYNSKATATRTIAIGEESNANSEDGIALGYKTQATSGSAVAIGREVVSSGDSAVALGKGSKATGRGSLALATGANATGNDGYAIGWASNASAESTMAFGHSSKARKNYDIAFGREAETRDQGVGDSIAIGHGAVSGSNRGGLDRNGTDAGSVAIGTGAYTGVNRDNISLNSSVAIGAGAGAGFRRLDTNNNNMPVNNATDVDNNDEVLKKAFGVKNVSDYTTIAGGANGYTNVDINEATALGRNARAIGDQAVAIGAQTIAGHGAVALGGNDITQFADKKYYKSNKENFAVTETIDHNQDATLSDDTIRGAYKRLVGTDLDTAYKATYAQDGSVVLGAQAHSGTPLGTALGTNALIRKGAFGATAIGAGSQIQANADAAVAIGMGSRADGSYAVAAGTASLAALGDVAIGYQSEATGKEGAISIGQATKAKGDSSIIIGGANIASAASRNTEFISEKQDSKGVRDTYFKDITETINGETVTRRYTYVTLEDKSDTIEKAYATLTGKDMNKNKLDYNEKDSKGEYVNKNGHASTSVGVHSLAKGDLASAFGASSRANAIGSLALGTGAQALVQNSVAIGTGSIAGDSEYKNASYDVTKSDPVVMGTRQLSVSYDKDGKIVSDAASNIAYTFKWAGGENTAPGDIVSFGTKGAERQLKHVAAGRIAENSTDAVNGSQLNAIIERFIGDKIKYFSVKSDVAGNHYNDGATGKDSIAIGPAATATKDNATATGNKSKASEENATAYGYNVEATGKSSVALGTSVIKPGTTTLVTTEASGENATALGVASKAKGVNSVALGYGVEADKDFATAIGSEAKVTAEGGIALGAGSVASVAGVQTGISVDGDVDGARTNVYTNLKNNINNSKISGANGAVSVGSSTGTRQIVNLAAGTNDTDAVNVAQLKSVNLAFKGNTGTGDVRLHDQRLTVESSNTDLLTVEASDKKLTFTPKTATLNIDNTTGSTTLGKVVAPTTDGLVKASELANTLNNMYWNVATSKNSDTGASHNGDDIPQPVKPGETVNFIAGEHVTIGQNGRDITISMKDALTQVQLNNAIQQTFGNGNNTTLSNKDGVLKYSLDDNISLDSVTTGTTVLKNGKVTGLNDNLTNTEDSTDPNTGEPIPVTNATIPNTFDAKDKKNAATVGDVLNSGWNLQNNGTAKDFVRPYDTVNFVDGANTKAVVRTDKAGKVSNVTYNVVGLPMTYTDANGAPVSKVGDKYYKTDEAGNVLDNAGNPVTKYDTNGNPLNADGTPVTAVTNPQINLVNSNPVTGKTGTTDPTTLGNIKSGLDTIKKPDGTTTPDSNNKTAGLVKLDTPNVSDNNVATVGDLRNMGWVVSAEGNSYSDQVKNANEVNFVGKNGLTVTGKTEANGVRTITIENSHSPITYTDENGNKLRKVGDNFYPEDAVVNNGNVYPAGSVVIDGAVYPEGTRKLANGDIVNQDGNHVSVATPVASTPSDKVKATLSSVVQNKPTTLSNVGNNLKQVQDPEGTTPGGVKNPDGTPVTDNGTPTGNPVTITNKAPYTAKEAADIVKNAGNNAATVGDVLNAGWNLQGNGKAVDFVKPYDTVNFRDGGNTTVTYETNGTTSHMQVNVTGLPVTNTITDPTTGKQIPLVKVGDTYYPANADGTPNIQKDEYGNPTNGYTIADNGKIYNSGDVTFGPEQANGTKTKTNNPGATPVTINSNMSNPNVPTDSKNAVNTPTQLGNVANGAKTHNPVGADGIPLKQANDGNYYPATKVNEDGSLAIDAGPGMTYPPVKPVEMGNDGKWYEKDNLDPNGNPKQGATEVPNPLKDKSKKSGLIDFANSNPNNVATVGDLRNMGWVVSSDKTTGDLETAYNDQVRNANEVKFVGTGMATVSGKTVDGVRTITVDVNAQKTVEEAQVPVVYTDKDGNKLTKIGDKFYNKAAVPTGVVSHNGNLYPVGSVVIGNKVYPVGSRVDGAGNVVDGAGNLATEENPIKEVEKNKVKASMNSGDNTTTPTTLSNVKGNLPQVNDKDKTVNGPDGKSYTKDGNVVTGNTKAPITADEASDIMKPTIVNEAGETVANPNYAGNNAATVGDVLNAGWNLQNNGTAKDFVKPYDTINFINGKGTVANVETVENGTSSTVTFNIDNGTITNETNGLVKASGLDKVVENAQNALTKAQNDDKAGSTPTTQAALKAAQDALTKAQNDKANADNKVATVENVVSAINNSGFTLKADKTDGQNLTDKGLKNGELIKPGSTVTMKAGKNMTVNQEANGNITYATKDDVEFNTVKVGAPETYKETATGAPVIKGKDGNFYKPADINNAEYIDGKYYPAGTVKNPDGSITATPVASIPGANVTTTTNPQINFVRENATSASNNGTGTTIPTTALNVSSTDGKPTQITGVGSVLDSNSVITSPNGTATTGDDQPKLVNLGTNYINDTKDKPLAETVLNSAATVRDLANMGWVVSSDKATGNLSKPYKDVVKNANEVKFIGKNGIQVSGKTDAEGVRTLTFEMEAGEVTPTEITKADGTKLVKVGDKVYKPKDIGTDGQPKQGKDPVGTIANDGKVYNNGDVTNGAPNDGANPIDGITVTPNNGSKFVTGNQVADAIEKSGFIVGKNNKALSAVDFKNEDEKVNPNDELRFADGDNTNVKLATKDEIDATGKVKTVTTVKVDVVDLPVKYTDEDGNIVKKGEDGKYYDPKDLAGKVYDPATKTYKNADGTTLTTQPTAKDNDKIVSSLVNPNDGKEGKAGTPSTLTNVANGAKTYEAKVDVNGNPLIKVGTDYYTADQLDKNGQPKAGETAKTPTQDIKMGKDGKWYPADSVLINNKYYPAGSVVSKNGNVYPAGTTLDKDGNPTTPGTTPVTEVKPVATPVNPGKAGLVDFNNSNPTNAATVGDLQNMGWVVSTSDTGYNDQVRNANKVDFKQGTGIKINGETTADGTRQITIGLDTGKVTNEVTITKPNGEKVNAIKVTQPDGTIKYYGKDNDGKADLTKEVAVGTGDNDNKVTADDGSRVVTGNTVATAIQESGWNIGKADAKDVTKAFETGAKLHDKVNPNDNVKFVDGDNTTVSMVTIDSKDEAGTKVATTYIKTDINRDIHIDSVTTGGKITNNAGDTMMLGNDGKYYPAGSVENNGKYYPAGSVVSKTGNVYPAGTTLDKDGNPTTPVSPITTPLTPTEVTDVKVAPKTELTEDGIKVTPARSLDKNEDPNKVVNLTSVGLNNGGNNITNVKSNLPQVNDKDKTVIGPDGKPYTKDGNVVTGNNKAPITAEDVANVLQPYELNNDGTTKVDDKGKPVANKNYAGNNAATVSDVLNAGWNLQNNGEAKDFVKPYDTVNFINGGNTTAVVTTDANGTTSHVTYNVTGLPISYTDKDGKPVSKFGDSYYKVDNAGNVIDANGNPAASKNANGQYVDNAGNVINPIDTSKNPLTINLVNPNVSADKATKTPMKIGNIESGAKTFDAPKDKNGNPLTKANDGKWYLSNEVDSNGTVKKGAKVKDPVIGNVTENNDPRKAGLINFGDSKSNATNVATVGDLQNMGWVVSTSDTGYNDQVRNANVVDFKEGEGIKISGETLENGVRQIKVGIDKNVVATKQELAQVERLSSAGIAGVAAMANIPQINEAASNRYNIAVGVGYHKGEKALAVGISGVSDGGRVVYKASAALDSQKQTTVGLGVGYQFGKRDIEPNELDRFRAQLDLVNTQKSSLAQRLKEQSIEIEELKKQNKILNEKIDMILRNNSNK